jgi:hypothetical protein
MSTKYQLPSQMDLVSHICKAFGKHPAKPRHINAIIKAADMILAELRREDLIAPPGAGYQLWLRSDDTGMSSKYLAMMLHGGGAGPADFAFPHDADDFGRCYRMLRVVVFADDAMARVGPTLPHPWPALCEHWKKLESMFEACAYSALYYYIQDLTKPEPPKP